MNTSFVSIRFTLAFLCAAGALMAPVLHAATHYVIPGETIQAKVTAAAAGDTIVIFGGVYNESVTVNKDVSLQRRAGESVTIAGSLTVTGVSGTGASPYVISNLKVGEGDVARKLFLNNCTNVTVYNMDLAVGGFSFNTCSNVVVDATTANWSGGDNNERVWVGNSTVNETRFTKTDITFSRAQITWEGHVNNTATPARAFNFLQSTNKTGYVSIEGGKGRFLYSRIHRILSKNADSVIMGNRIRKDAYSHESAVNLDGGGKAVVRNNDISCPMGGFDWNPSANNGVLVDNVEALVANNYFHDFGGGSSGSYEGDDDRNGVWVRNNAQPVRIHGNIFWTTRRPVFGAFDRVTYSHNCDNDGANRHGGGVASSSNIAGDPKFVDRAAGNYALAAGSPCLNAGPAFTWLNDRDGSRNDIGLYGGAAYDPAGTTTDKPITFLLQGTPYTVIKGVHPDLTITGGGVVVGR